MKIRTGFVSNSSSSSFVIGVKGELTEEKVMKAFGVGEKSVLYKLAKEMAKLMVDLSEELSEKEMMSDDYHYGLEEEKVLQLIKKDFKFYKGSASSDGEPVECALCEAVGIEYEDDEIFISKEEAY